MSDGPEPLAGLEGREEGGDEDGAAELSEVVGGREVAGAAGRVGGSGWV